MEHVSRAKEIQIDLIPGQKLCPACRGKLYNDWKDREEISEVNEVEEGVNVDEEMNILESSFSTEESRQNLSTCFTSIGVSPMKLRSLPSSSKIIQGKRKIETAVTSMTEKVAKVLSVPVEKVRPEVSKEEKKKV